MSDDAGHHSFLELIRAISQSAGAPFAEEGLVETGIDMAKAIPVVEFSSFEEFVASIDTAGNPNAEFEGKARHYGNGVFGLPVCPFAAAIQKYEGVSGELPPEFDEVTRELNKPSALTDRLHIGEGSAVSPFCGVHQPTRSVLGERVLIGGRRLVIFQLGCKSGAGVKGFAEGWIEQAGVDRKLVDKVLDSNMCCYCARVENSGRSHTQPTK